MGRAPLVCGSRLRIIAPARSYSSQIIGSVKQLHIALKRTEKHLKKNILLLVFRVNTKTTLCIVPIRTSAPLAVNSGTKFLVVSSVIIVTPPVGHCEGMHDVVQKAEGTENHANRVWILPDHGLFHRGIFH